MIEKEGKMQVEITGAWKEVVETQEEGEVDIVKVQFKDAKDNEDELAMWLSGKLETRGKYKNKPQFEANLNRLKDAGMTDMDIDNLDNIKGAVITVFGKEKDGYYNFYWQDTNKIPSNQDVKNRLLKLRGRTEAMAGTPTDAPPPADEGDDDNLPF